MKKIFIPVLSLLMLVLAGCSAVPEATPTPEVKAPEITEESDDSTSFISSWQRTGNYADGELVSSASSITTFTDDGTYTSIGTCAVTGTYGFDIKDEKEQIIMRIATSSCPGGPGAGYTVTWWYEISDDGQNMTLTTVMQGVTVKETFVRIK
jgi:hypothetical protein